jgi:hypothetical protein
MIINTGITEQAFADILSLGDLPAYDPALHLLPRVAARTWQIDPKSAAERLKRNAAAWGLVEIKVLNPETGHALQAYRRAG